jgi:glycosyltransferase involved in cell wall biosynthesis
VPSGAFVFGFAGRLVALKAVDVLLQAFASARAALPPGSCVVIAGDGPERARLEEQAMQLGLQSHTHFLGFQAKPWEVYPGFDTLLLPSRVEACGTTALEAMACGCEVIASEVGGIPEIVAGGELATLVAPGSVGELSAAMVSAAARSHAGRAAASERVRAHVLQNFDRRVQYRRISSALADASHFDRPRLPQWAVSAARWPVGVKSTPPGK